MHLGKIGLLWAIILLGSCSSNSHIPNVTDEGVAETFTTRPESKGSYTLVPGDQIDVQIFRSTELGTPDIQLNGIQVRADGSAYIRSVGMIKAAGLNVDQFRSLLKKEFEQTYVTPLVEVTVTQARGRQYYVLGEVNTPGRYTLDVNTTALEGISIAGGFTPDAEKAKVILLRGNRATTSSQTVTTEAVADFERFLEKAQIEQNVILQPDDVIYVPSDFIAKSGRLVRYIQAVVQPVAAVTGAIGTIIVISNTSDRQ